MRLEMKIHREKNVMLHFMLSFFWHVIPVLSLYVSSHYAQINLTPNKGPQSVFHAAGLLYTTWHTVFCASALQRELRPSSSLLASGRSSIVDSYNQGSFFKIKNEYEGNEVQTRLKSVVISCCC